MLRIEILTMSKVWNKPGSQLEKLNYYGNFINKKVSILKKFKEKEVLRENSFQKILQILTKIEVLHF